MGLLLALFLAASTFADTIHVEAEDAVLNGLTVESEIEGFSGTGYVAGFGDEATLSLDVELAQGVYEFGLRVLGPANGVHWQIAVGSDTLDGRLVRMGGGFHERSGGHLWLPEGQHTIEITGDAQLRIDYLRLVRRKDLPSTPSAELTNPNATDATRALYQFLLSEYGRHILAGQQELREVEYIEDVTGYEVAIAGGDLIEYSPSRWERGARPNKDQNYASVEDYIEWAGDDGIVAMMWHWNAPTDLVGDWWRGFYTDGTTFNFAEALADPASENYGLLLRDIDAIADRLKQFADADIPVLWRPLHEAAGTWFWWGARGPDPFRELWRLLYDRLTNHHRLNNLIWVYTHEPDANDWYPGDDVVDIVGIDVYANDHREVMTSEWNEMTSLYDGQSDGFGHHLAALTESGTLPDPVVITDHGVWWSWFSMWNDWPGEPPTFVRDVDPAYFEYVMGHDLVMTRDELPDWRSFGVGTESVRSFDARFEAYPNPSTGTFVVHLEGLSGEDGRIEVFDILGRRVHAQRFEPQFVDRSMSTTVDLGTAAPGVYVVRITSGQTSLARSIVIAGR